MDKMKAVIYFQYGTPDVLTNGVVDIPVPSPSEILVKITSCGINPLDYKIRQGKLKLITGKKFPKIPGSDFSGIVEESQSSKFKKGDHVVGISSPILGGGYAEFIRVNENSALKIPNTLDLNTISALPIAGLTALQSLRDKGLIGKTTKLLIIGASGGVGTFAVQIAKIYGAHTTAVCSNRNIKLVSSLGADKVIDYTSEDWLNELEKYDVIFDTVNAFTLSKARKFMNPGSIYIMTAPGVIDIFSTLNPFNLQYNFKSIAVRNNMDDLKTLVDWVKSKKLEIIIDKVFQFDDAVNAHIYGESKRARGKLILKL